MPPDRPLTFRPNAAAGKTKRCFPLRRCAVKGGSARHDSLGAVILLAALEPRGEPLLAAGGAAAADALHAERATMASSARLRA